VRRTVPPSAEIQANIDKLLTRELVDDPAPSRPHLIFGNEGPVDGEVRVSRSMHS
jgi:hypothetical protein